MDVPYQAMMYRAFLIKCPKYNDFMASGCTKFSYGKQPCYNCSAEKRILT
jgi:hypothetical protein